MQHYASPSKAAEAKYTTSLGYFGTRIAIIYSAISVLIWAWITYQYSTEKNPNYQMYQYKLSTGWIFNRQIDNSDAQYRSFRNNIPIMIIVMIVHQLISKLISSMSDESYQPIASQPYPVTFKTIWTLSFSILFLFVLFGLSLIKIFIIVLINYSLTKLCHSNVAGPLFSWTFAITILFLNYFYKGYTFGSISDSLSWMDEWKGMGISWRVTFNFTVLRMISFSMDYYWNLTKSCAQFEAHLFECRNCESGTQLCDKGRTEKGMLPDEYHIINYLCYLLYAPLYMAGPIISFNNFMQQIRRRSKEITLLSTTSYALKWVLVVFLMEIMLHLFHVVAIKDTKAWKGFSALQLFTLGYFNLTLIWLKLTIIWRWFRLWAMIDGMETVENMTKCMTNHYSGIGFWRNWHSSFNKWLIRYLYIPLGGANQRAWNTFVIFTFVAGWHDIELKLLAWGWLIALFILPEILCVKIFCTNEMRDRFGDLYIHLCAFGGLLNILMMMTANLVGFALGTDGMWELLGNLLQPSGFTDLVFCCSSLFSFVHVQFAHEGEKRNHKRMKSS